MKRFLLLFAAIAAVALSGCSKYDNADNKLVPSVWVGYENNSGKELDEIRLYFALFHRCVRSDALYLQLPDREYWYTVKGNKVRIKFDATSVSDMMWGDIDLENDEIHLYSSSEWEGAILLKKGTL